MHKRACKAEFRSSDTGPELFGRMFSFSETPDGHYGKERFDKNCRFDFSKRVFLLRGHDPERILGRRGKNLSFRKDSEGLNFEVSRLPDTPLGKETRTLVKEGLLDGASVGFFEKKSRMDGDIKVFEDVRIAEVSLVANPYYESSSVAARSKDIELLPPDLI